MNVWPVSIPACTYMQPGFTGRFGKAVFKVQGHTEVIPINLITYFIYPVGMAFWKKLGRKTMSQYGSGQGTIYGKS